MICISSQSSASFCNLFNKSFKIAMPRLQQYLSLALSLSELAFAVSLDTVNALKATKAQGIENAIVPTKAGQIGVNPVV